MLFAHIIFEGVILMDVVTLGETMILFTPETTGSMRYASTFSSQIAGSESNVAIGLARLGHQAGWISRLGNDEFGKKILNFIRGEGVNVDEVCFDDTAPTGLYFKEVLTEDEVNVTYYRKGSAASKMDPEKLNDSYIANAKYLHITGITPALSKSCYKVVMRAIEVAQKHQVTVVFDPNIRYKLWSEEHARKVLLEIAAKSDIVLPGIDEGIFLFGKKDPKEIAREFYNLGASMVVIKLGAYGAYCLSNEISSVVPGFDVKDVKDPVGAGDGFAAGFLSGLLDGLTLKKAIERGNAIGALVIKVHGDIEGLPERNRMISYISGTELVDVNR